MERLTALEKSTFSLIDYLMRSETSMRQPYHIDDLPSPLPPPLVPDSPLPLPLLPDSPLPLPLLPDSPPLLQLPLQHLPKHSVPHLGNLNQPPFNLLNFIQPPKKRHDHRTIQDRIPSLLTTL